MDCLLWGREVTTAIQTVTRRPDLARVTDPADPSRTKTATVTSFETVKKRGVISDPLAVLKAHLAAGIDTSAKTALA